MIKRLVRRLSPVRFRNKIILVFAALLSLVTAAIVVLQIHLSNRLRFKDTQDSLSLITEQVGINFSTTLHEQEIRLYNAMQMFDLPRMIRRSGAKGSTLDLQLALSQMLSTTSPFDFLMIRTPKDAVLTATTLLDPPDELAAGARDLLFLDRESGGNLSKWYRDETGSIYLVRDIYDISPLTHCGYIAAHLKGDALFSIGEQGRELEYIFLFFTTAGPDPAPQLLYALGTKSGELLENARQLEELARQNPSTITLNGSRYFVSQVYCDGIRTVGLSPLQRVRRSNTAAAHAIVLCGAAGLVAGVIALMLCMRRLMQQLNSLTNAMDNLASGQLDQMVPVVSEDDIGQLTVHFNNMSHRITLLMQRVAQEETLKINAQFKLLEYRYRSLQTQLNPHFIFNSFEAINALAKVGNNQELSRSILRISHYFRLITSNMNHQFITVAEELESLEDYAQIHQTIQGKRLEVSFCCEAAARLAVIPTMCLQPVLENALVHGLCSGPQVSAVHVSAQLRDGKRLLLSVTDNGPGIPPELRQRLLGRNWDPPSGENTGVGLRSILERLMLLYGNDAAVDIESQPGRTCVSITLPLSYENPLDFDPMSL